MAKITIEQAVLFMDRGINYEKRIPSRKNPAQEKSKKFDNRTEYRNVRMLKKGGLYC